MTLKDLFKDATDGKLSYEELEAKAKEAGAKFTDLSEGKYVSKAKYEDDIKAKDGDLAAKDNEIASRDEQISTLNGTIATRDEDLANLQKQLEEAGQDATKLAELNTQFTGLQAKYDADVKEYQTKMQKQQYEFAVKEFANTKNFTSQAAKRDFVKSMIERGLQMDGDKILGREDFAEKYAEENADAFVVQSTDPEPAPAPNPNPEPTPSAPIPEIVAPTPGPDPSSSNDGGFHFNFTGVRANNQK